MTILLIVIAGLALGAAVWFFLNRNRAPWGPIPGEAADIIEGYLAGNIGMHEWDDFLSVGGSDPQVFEAAARCIDIQREHETDPDEDDQNWIDEEGIQKFHALIRELRGNA